MLTVDGLVFRYPGGPPVLAGAALRLVAGQVTGLLGANGSGKSTLLGAITNSIEGGRAGRIEIAPEAKGPIGFATQDIALYRHLTVAENLTHAARLATGRWRVDALVSRAIEDFRLGRLRGTTARSLSGGQQRIAHLACAFVHRPSIRLLDEPTTALDFATRQLLLDLVAAWRGEGVATLVTAHYPEDVEELCSTLTMLVDGRTHNLGPLRAYLDQQSRLGHVELIGPGGTSTHVELHGMLDTGDRIITAARGAGLDLHQQLRSIQIKPPALRDLLRRDPSLRAGVEERVG